MLRRNDLILSLSIGASLFLGILFAALVLPSISALLLYILILMAAIPFLWRKKVFLAIGSSALSAAFITCMIELYLSDGFGDKAVLRNFLVGDSDSHLYNLVASDASRWVPLSDQLKLWDLSYLEMLQDSYGMIFQDIGYFWFICFFYTIVGEENGPFALAVINPILIAASIVWLTQCLMDNRARQSSFIRLIAATFALCFFYFSQSTVMQVMLSCRKDVLVVFAFSAAVALYAKGKRLPYALAFIATTALRFGYLVPLVAQIVTGPMAKRHSLDGKAIMLLGLAAFFFSPPLYSALLSYFGMEVEVTKELSEMMETSMGGSAMLINNWWLNWLYAVGTPLPSLNFSGYVNLDGKVWRSLFGFIINIMFLWIFLHVTRNNIKRVILDNDIYNDYCIIVVFLYLSFVWVVTISIGSGLIGAMEPRYKIVIWTMQLAIGLQYYLECMRVQTRT